MSRHAGLPSWLVQRVSAVYLAGYSVFLLWHFAKGAPPDHQAWAHWLAVPGVSVGAALFIVALLLHAWVGVRDIIMDYVRATAARLTLLAVIAVGYLACGLWALRVLWQASPA